MRAALQRRIERRLAESGCDVVIDGKRPWDIRVNDERFFSDVLARGSLGLGESYMAGAWDCGDLTELFVRLLRAGVDRHAVSIETIFLALRAAILNLQSPHRAREVGRVHYDIGNDLFEAMLGEPKVYSCAYWRDADTLEEAQRAKLDLVCEKLDLKPGMRVLDIGCGWGDTARHIAERHQVEVVGIGISEEQTAEAQRRCRHLPIEIALRDYRDQTGRFDRIVSLGMFEHVGPRNHRRFMRKVRELLDPAGLALVQTIGTLQTATAPDPWIARWIFPNGKLPSAAQITRAMEGSLVLEDWHSFGPDYDRTLQAWLDNFEESWPRLSSRYDERFRRMWRYYLCLSSASFRTRRNQLWQIVLSPQGTERPYRSVR
jgi:cyclopropane-fatty-acyl-phospholipid synthase